MATLALTGARLLDGIRPAIDDAALVVDGERIVEVGTGVRFVLGDDYGAIGFPHGGYGGELRLSVEQAGVTPLDVIAWATRNGAEMVGREDDLGTVEVGKRADLVVVDGDPSADIGSLADHPPRAVLKGGEVVAGSLVADGR